MLVKLRYNIITKLIKYITPNLYEKLCILARCTSLNFQDIINNDLPRPSIVFMKAYFKNVKVNGVEIGVQKGINSSNILYMLNIRNLYLVDIWSNLEHYLIVLDKFRNYKKVIIIKNTSINASREIANNSLDFIYIDANHKYRQVYNDLDYWFPKIKKKGIISGHDIFSHLEVLRAVKDWCIKSKINFIVKPPDFYFIKP